MSDTYSGGGSLLSGGLGLLGGYLGSGQAINGIQQGIGAIQSGYGDAIKAITGFYNQGQAQQQPFLNIGTNAAGLMGRLYGFGTGANGANGAPDASAFHTDPGYQFALDQGNKSLYAQNAASGQTMSGAAAKGAIQFGQGTADQQYGNYISRLQNLINTGQSTATAMGNQGADYARTVGGTYTGEADALSSAYGSLGQAQGKQTSGLLGGIGGLLGGIGGGALSIFGL